MSYPSRRTFYAKNLTYILCDLINQVQKVQEEATLYINQIQKYKVNETTRIETELQTLLEIRENLEDVKAESTYFIENNNAVDFINGAAEMTKKLNTHYTQEPCALSRANTQPLESEYNQR